MKMKTLTINEQRFHVVDDGSVRFDEGMQLNESQQSAAQENMGIAEWGERLDALAELSVSKHEQYFDITANGLVFLKEEYRGAGNASYEYSVSDKGVKVVGSMNSELPENLVIPDVVNKITVKELAPAMFMLNNAVKNITIPSGVTEIPEKFCDRAMSIEGLHGTINVETLGTAAFQGTRLKKVEFPRLRNFSGVGQFNQCVYLVSADIGDTVTELSDNCFYYCEMLESILGGASIIKIGEKALRGTHRLKNVSFTPNLREIGNYGLHLSGLNHYWHTHFGCNFGTYATPAQWNPNDFWSNCSYKPCVTQLRSTFHQSNPAWSEAGLAGDGGLTAQEKKYANNCVLNAGAMAYSILEEKDISSPVDFIKAVKAVNSSITSSNPAYYKNIANWFEELGYATEECKYGDDLQKLYDALAEGHLVIGSVLSQSDDENTHAVLFHGVTEKGEIMACDSENYRKQFGDYKAITYSKQIQNLSMPVNTSGNQKQTFVIIKKKET